MICIYVAIGQKASTVAGVVETLERHGAMKNTIIVAATASDSAPLQYIAPMAGAAMGEYFVYNGEDGKPAGPENKGRAVLIVYDDPVSYTHLDVYKRQPRGRGAAPEPGAPRRHRHLHEPQDPARPARRLHPHELGRAGPKAVSYTHLDVYKRQPHDLPLLYVAGDADPVGKCGRAVAAAAESMEAAGAEDLTLRLFPGMRHEILNEFGKEEVYDFILNWINLHE